MEQNWVIKEAKKAGTASDRVVLEKPDVKRYLDDLLLKRFWPVIHSSLEASDYAYLPKGVPETELEHSVNLTRSLRFMLLDKRFLFFRGKLSCSTDGWMLSREFYLSLAGENDFKVVIAILGNSRFAGLPPTLSMDRAIDKNGTDFYQITFHAGSGAGWGYGEEYLDNQIKKVIDVNIRMNDFTRGSVITPQQLGEFLTIAYEAYEAY